MPETRIAFRSISIRKGIGKKTAIRIELFKGDLWTQYPEAVNKIRMRINNNWYPEKKVKFYTPSEVVEYLEKEHLF